MYDDLAHPPHLAQHTPPHNTPSHTHYPPHPTHIPSHTHPHTRTPQVIDRALSDAGLGKDNVDWLVMHQVPWGAWGLWGGGGFGGRGGGLGVAGVSSPTG